METIVKPTEKEIENAKVVFDMLIKIDGIAVIQQSKEDLFVVEEEDTGLSCIVDVEEDIVSVILKVADFDLTKSIAKTANMLLKANNEALYGAFAIEGNSILFKNNLDIENLDLNELQSTLTSVFLTVSKNLESISESLAN